MAWRGVAWCGELGSLRIIKLVESVLVVHTQLKQRVKRPRALLLSIDSQSEGGAANKLINEKSVPRLLSDSVITALLTSTT